MVKKEDKKTNKTNKPEKALRPKKFIDIIGREKEKRSLEVMIQAAKERGEALDHILFHGPPGLGKTTLSHVIANEMGVDICVTSGPAIERQGDLASVLTNMSECGILFIDEIHRLNKVVEEILYPAMEDSVIDIVIGKGPSARTLRLDLPNFTVIGATTRVGMVSSPLRNRFGAVFRLDFYSVEDLKKLVLQKAKMLNIDVEESGADEIAKRSRGTARIAVRLIKRVRDYSQVENCTQINKKITDEALNMLKIDKEGLDEVDRKILEVILSKFNGGPVGLSTIAAAISEELDTIAEVYEPYLIQSGFLKRTPRGRVVTKKAFKHLHFPFDGQKDEVQGDLL